MKKILETGIFFIVFCVSLFADEFVVKSFRLDNHDLSARVNPIKDTNDEFCAIIKISTDVKGLKFYSNQLEYMQKMQYDYWLYVSSDIRYMEIQGENFISLQYSLPMRLESSKVYRMVLTGKDQASINAIENTMHLAFKFNENDVYISYNNLAPTRTRGNSASFKLPPDQYNFKFTKEGFSDLTRTINLEKDEIINITLKQGQSQTRMTFPGIVTINSEPTGAEVYINGQMAGQTPHVDELMPGQYNLSLQKKFYHTSVSTFDLKEQESMTIPIIKLKPKFAYIAIKTKPAQSKVFMNNKLLGNSPISRQQVESGNYSIRIEKDLYHTEEITISLQDGDDENYNYNLKPAFGTLIIKSNPENADVFIDGKSVGKTPYRNTSQPSGQYSVRVTKDKWYPAEEIIQVSDNQITEKTLILSQNFGTLSITANESNIYLNNKKIAIGNYTDQLPPGKYNLKAIKDKHYDATKEIFLKIGDNQSITLKPEPKMASLSVISQPTNETMGSRILINNKVLPDKTTPAVLPLLIGNYNITLKHRNYLEKTMKVTLKEGERQKLIFNMQTYSGSMLQKENAWKRNKRLSFVTSILIAGAGVYCNYLGDQAYDNFQAAKITDTADNAWDESNNMYLYRDISYSVSVVPVVFGMYSWIKQIGYKNKRVR